MALFDCPHCGGKVGEGARWCPHCGGYPFSIRRRQFAVLGLLLIVLAAAVAYQLLLAGADG